MSSSENAQARLQAKLAEVKRHREQVLKNMGLEEKGLLAKPTCAACGGYAHVAAVGLCKNHSEKLEGKVYCIYCLSNITGFSPDELKLQYEEESH